MADSETEVRRRFGQEVRRRREAAGLSLRGLEARSGIPYGYLGQIERGERRCSRDWAEIIDTALGAGGELVAIWEDDVRRRTVIGAAAALPKIAGEALRLTAASSAIRTEAVRHDLAAMLSGTVNDWDEIAWQYACTYADTPPRLLLADLERDLIVASMQLRQAGDDAMRSTVRRAIGQLSAFMAQTMGNLGDFRSGYRWWRNAREYADASQDAQTRVWVRGREVIRGMYERRPLHLVLELAEEAEAISSAPGSGIAEVLAGRAQALAILGRADDAAAAMQRVYAVVDELPSAVVDDTQSMFGWPLYRLRHTESFVYTHLRHAQRAEAACDQALGLYPEHMARERTQVELHRAMRIVQAGDAVGGAAYARELIESLPTEQRIEVVLELARSVAAAVPLADRRQPEVADFREMLALPPGR